MKPSRTASIYPTADEINALPEKFRQYIHDIETRCDKTGDVQTIALLREDRDALQRRVEELEAQNKADDRPEGDRIDHVMSLALLCAALCHRAERLTSYVEDDRRRATQKTRF